MALGFVSARPRLVIGLGLLVAAGLAGGSGYALVKASDDKGKATALPVVTASPTPSTAPSESASPSAAAVVATSPTPSPTVTATPSVTPSPTPTATVSPSPRASVPTVRYYAYPKPTRPYAGLYFVQVSNTPGSGTTDTNFRVKIEARDADGAIAFGGMLWGDGASVPGAAPQGQCAPRPSPTTQPGPYQPQADDKVFTQQHRYTTPGTYTIIITVKSGNVGCRPNGPTSETQSISLQVTVTAPTPSPTAS